MLNKEIWENLLIKALKHIDSAKIPDRTWTLGGGTVLMLNFSHRMSKDVDIFFSDKQHLSAISPRINDEHEDYLCDYIEQDNFCKLVFPEGKIDFIYSRMISNHKPQSKIIAGKNVQCEDPVEIVAKKIYWRNDRFTSRDIFDLAVVCNTYRNRLIETMLNYPDKVNVLAERIALHGALDDFNKWAMAAHILPRGERFLKTAMHDVIELIESVRVKILTIEHNKHKSYSR